MAEQIEERVYNEDGYYGRIEDKPPTEQELFALQDKLFQKRKEYKDAVDAWSANPSLPKPVDESGKVWSDMLNIIFSYAKSMILKRNVGKRYMEPEDVADKAIESALAFMNQYNKKEDFKIGASFAGVLKWKIIESLYKGREDYHISLNQVISEDSDSELIDSISIESAQGIEGIAVYNPEDEILREDPQDIIKETLAELDNVIDHDSRLAFITRLYVLITLRCPRTRHIKRLFLEQWAQNNYQTEQVLESSVLELFNRLKGISLD